MIHLPASVRLYLCLTPCDMRSSFDELHALALGDAQNRPNRPTELRQDIDSDGGYPPST